MHQTNVSHFINKPHVWCKLNQMHVSCRQHCWRCLEALVKFTHLHYSCSTHRFILWTFCSLLLSLWKIICNNTIWDTDNKDWCDATEFVFFLECRAAAGVLLGHQSVDRPLTAWSLHHLGVLLSSFVLSKLKCISIKIFSVNIQFIAIRCEISV